MIWLAIAFLASILTAFQLIPQTIKTVQGKDLTGVSLLAFSIISITTFLWLLYGLHLNNVAIIFANSISLICAVIIVTMKLKRK
jgi:MtN3 and saliva related transmembrane protein